MSALQLLSVVRPAAPLDPLAALVAGALLLCAAVVVYKGRKGGKR